MIVPAYTFPATANVVELCGARAVLVDVDPETFLVDPAAVAAAVTPRTRAVMAVHLFGRPVEWEALQTAVPQEVALVEDAAGALGARYRGTAVRRARRRGLPLLPSAQDRDHRRGRRRDDGRGGLGRGRAPAAPPRLGVARRHARHRASTTGFPISCARSGSRRSRGSRSCSRLGSASRAGTRSGSSRSCSRRAPPRATGTAGRRTSSSSTGATRRSRGCARQGIEAQIGTWALHRLEPVPRARAVPGSRPRVRARARAALRDDDDRGRGRAGRLCPRSIRVDRAVSFERRDRDA